MGSHSLTSGEEVAGQVTKFGGQGDGFGCDGGGGKDGGGVGY